MFNSEIFKTEVHPIFGEEFQCSLRVVGKDNSLKPIDFLDLQKLPKRESILVLALVETSIMREESQLQKKLSLQKELKKKYRKMELQDAELSMNLVIQIANKTKKIEALASYKNLLKEKIC